MNNILLISEKALKSYSLIDNNIDGKYILPAIQTAQNIDLENLIGPALLKKLYDLVDSDEIMSQTAYKTLLDEYIVPYLIYDVMTTVQLGLNYKFSNSGMSISTDEHRAQMEFRNNQLLVEQYRNYANSYALKLKAFLDNHSNDYPEYLTKIDCRGANDVQPGGIFFDKRCKCRLR